MRALHGQPQLFPDIGAGIWAVDEEEINVAVGAGINFLDTLADRLVVFIDRRTGRKNLGRNIDV